MQWMACITGTSADLPGMVMRKKRAGFSCVGDPLKIGGGYFVQRMIDKKSDWHIEPRGKNIK